LEVTGELLKRRVVGVTVGGKPLDEKKKYTLATSDYVGLSGGDGYAMLKEARVLIPPDQARFDSDVLRSAIATMKVIAPRTDGRIKRLDKDQKAKTDCDK
jgi:5'-nucleotidase